MNTQIKTLKGVLSKTSRLLAISVLMASLLVPVLSPIATALPTWTEVQPAGYEAKIWWSTSMSNDGQTILATDSTLIGEGVAGRMYLTRNGGNTWTEIQILGDIDAYWARPAVSGDGKTLLVAVADLSGETENYETNVYLSTNAGSSWAETQPAGDIDNTIWFGLAISGDGQTMLASEEKGLFMSKDGGGSWMAVEPVGLNEMLQQLVINHDGESMLIRGEYGRLYLSTNGGTSWAETQPAGDIDAPWAGLAISGDGQTMLAGSERLYISTDGGSSWAETQPAGDIDAWWSTTAINADGLSLLAGVAFTINENPDLNTPGRLYISRTLPEDNADYNNDGTPDSQQQNVDSLVNPLTDKRVVLELADDCEIQSLSVTDEDSNSVQDSGYAYDDGLVNFVADCGTPGYETDVIIYHYGVDSDDLVVRKHNPNTNAYFTVDDAVIDEQTIGGQTVTTASFSITDGGDLDIDVEANGVIVDPVGLASQAVGSPNTGLSKTTN